MRRLAALCSSAAVLSLGACGTSSSVEPDASAGSPAATSPSATSPEGGGGEAIDTAGAVAALRAVADAAAAHGLDGGNDIEAAGSCPLGVDTTEWAAEATGVVFCAVEADAAEAVFFAGLTTEFTPQDFLLQDGLGADVVAQDLGAHGGGMLSTHCVEAGFTPESFPIVGRCIATWESGDLVVGIARVPADDPVQLAADLTAHLATAVEGVAAFDVSTLQW